MKVSKLGLTVIAGAALTLGPVLVESFYYNVCMTPTQRVTTAEVFVVAHNVGLDDFCHNKAAKEAGDPYASSMFHNAELYHGINKSCHMTHPYL